MSSHHNHLSLQNIQETWMAAAKPLSKRMDIEPWREFLSCHETGNDKLGGEKYKKGTLGKGFSPTCVIRGACIHTKRKPSLNANMFYACEQLSTGMNMNPS